ncbi:Rpn family recombination-promoting nuclease/putative transposase [bacterium NHP-B]|nr:Rpn family recombination-promoting nuclease/putative transposase [bacterium NHP-B]
MKHRFLCLGMVGGVLSVWVVGVAPATRWVRLGDVSEMVVGRTAGRPWVRGFSKMSGSGPPAARPEMPAWMRGGGVPMTDNRSIELGGGLGIDHACGRALGLGPMRSLASTLVPPVSSYRPKVLDRFFHSAVRLWEGDDDGDHDALKLPPNSFADPRADLVFKKLLGSPENKDLLLHFLNRILDRRGDKVLTEAVLQKTESDNRGPDQKVFKLDLLCKDERGHQYIVEMEKDVTKNQRKSAFFKRLQFYGASVYTDQMKEAEAYQALKPVICIVLAGTEVFRKQQIAGPLSRHVIMEPGSQKSYFQDMQWVVVELPKVKLSETGLHSGLDEWLYLFHKGHKENRLPQVCSPTLKKAYRVIDQSTWTDGQRLAYRQWQIAQADKHEFRAKALLDGRKIGKKEGREEGRKEGLLEGEKRGLFKGKKEGLLEAVERLIAGGVTENEACDLLGISSKDVTAYRTGTMWEQNDELHHDNTRTDDDVFDDASTLPDESARTGKNVQGSDTGDDGDELDHDDWDDD